MSHVELIFRFSLGEILRKTHTESSFNDAGQQELRSYLRFYSKQISGNSNGSYPLLIFQLPSQLPHLLFTLSSPPFLMQIFNEILNKDL